MDQEKCNPTNVPNRDTYLKPTQYLKFRDQTIKAIELVTKLNLAVFERYNILHFYLLTVDPLDTESKNINEFVDCNGIQVKVYITLNIHLIIVLSNTIISHLKPNHHCQIKLYHFH